MNTNSRSELFESTPVPKAVLKLAIPTVLSSLVMILYNLADTFFVGMLNDPIENAAVTFAAPLLLAFNAVNNLFGVGSSSMMSRALGAKDYSTVRRSSAFGFYCALLCGVMFSVGVSIFNSPVLKLLGAEGDSIRATTEYVKWTVCFGAVPSILNVVLAYLIRSEGAALHAGIGTMSGCLLNIALDPLFILPQFLNMGASGAGLATFISNCFSCLYFIILILAKGKNTYVSISPKEFQPNRKIVFGVFKVGIPAAIQNLLNVTGMTVLNNFMSVYGETAVTAMGISHKIAMIPMYVSMGISQGVMPLVGYNYSARNIKRMKKATVFTTVLSVSFIFVCACFLSIFAENVIRAFMENEEVVRYGTSFLRAQAPAQVFLCMDFLAVGVFQACGMGLMSLIFAILRKVVLEIPAIIVLDKLFPMYGLAYSQLFAEAVLAASAIIFLIVIFKKFERQQKNSPLR